MNSLYKIYLEETMKKSVYQDRKSIQSQTMHMWKETSITCAWTHGQCAFIKTLFILIWGNNEHGDVKEILVYEFMLCVTRKATLLFKKNPNCRKSKVSTDFFKLCKNTLSDTKIYPALSTIECSMRASEYCWSDSSIRLSCTDIHNQT